MEWQNKNETKDIREDRNMIKGIIFFFFFFFLLQK
jgi:hypothetical protein